MPALTTFTGQTRRQLMVAIERLAQVQTTFGDRLLALVRKQLPDYRILTDDEIRSAAQQFMDTVIAELRALRAPDPALRELLHKFAAERAARGVPPHLLAASYQLGSRLMLAYLDEAATGAGLPVDLQLVIHDSVWEFSNEATAIFVRAEHDLALDRARFDAERRSAFARALLNGSFPAEQINGNAWLFGIDPLARPVPLAARATTAEDADAIHRAIAAALRLPTDRLLRGEIGTTIGVIAPGVPEGISAYLVAAGPAVPLERLHESFAEAVLALDTAQRFRQTGLVRLADLGPRPLVLTAELVAAALDARHLRKLDEPGRANADIEETTRVFLACNQEVRETAQRLAVHENTVRYRVQRFHELTGLNLRRTEDLVTAWWLLNRRTNLETDEAQ